MAKQTTYHVVPRKQGWAVKREDARRASSIHGTKEEAVRQAHSYAVNRRPSRLVIHKKNGAVQEERAYGEDVQASPRSQKPKLGEPYSFLHFARSLNLDGPEDWSARIDDYLYGHLRHD